MGGYSCTKRGKANKSSHEAAVQATGGIFVPLVVS